MIFSAHDLRNASHDTWHNMAKVFLKSHYIKLQKMQIILETPVFKVNASVFPIIIWNSKLINTQNMTNPTIVSPAKMEYGWNFSISGLKMMVKSGLEKIFLKFLYALTMSFLLLNLYFWPKILLSEVNSFNRKWWAHRGISKIFFLDHFSPSFLGQKC